MTRPASDAVRRLVAAHDALSAVSALDGDLLSGEDLEALVRLQGVLEAAQLELGRRTEVVVIHDGLGPCAECGGIVRAGRECSTCLEEEGDVVHSGCCLEGDDD